MSSKSPLISPFIGLLFGILAVSTGSILVRYAQRDVPSLVIAAYRLSFATLVLTPFVVSRHQAELAALTGRQIRLMALSGGFLALHFATWISSLEYTSVASSVVLVSTTPLWVALLSPVVLHERLKPALAVGLAVALAGGVVVGLGDVCRFQSGGLTCSGAELFSSKSNLGNLLALTGAVMASGYFIVGRKLRASQSLVVYTFGVYGTAAIVLIGLALVSGQPLFGYPARDYLWLVGLALIPQLLGHSTFNWALKYLSAAYVAVAQLGEPVGATLLAIVLLSEIPSALEIAGGVLILVGIFLGAQTEQVKSS